MKKLGNGIPKVPKTKTFIVYTRLPAVAHQKLIDRATANGHRKGAEARNIIERALGC